MAKPAVTVTAEPRESGELVYAPLAAKTTADPENGQLAVLFDIINQESSTITLDSVTVSFPNDPGVPSDTIAVVPPLSIEPSVTGQWYFQSPDHVILPEPAPGTVELRLSFTDFTDPAVVSLALTPYASDGYLFPARTVDLNKGELWVGTSAIHGGAGNGTQMFAYDLSAVGFNEQAGWDSVIDGTDGSQNAHYHCWGKPIYAMAAGTVVQFLDTMADNTTPPNFPNPAPSQVEGNHFYIQHGDDLALYAHLQLGSMNPDLLTVGAAVTEGQLLGLTGNTGRSSEPHLHLQIIRATQPWLGVGRPLTFRDLYVLELGDVPTQSWPPATNAQWNLVEGRALPNAPSAIWPGKLKITWHYWKKTVYVVAWAWLILIGGLMITPGGIDCLKCNPILEAVLSWVSIGAGIAGLATTLFGEKRAARGRIAPRVAMRRDLDGHEEMTPRM